MKLHLAVSIVLLPCLIACSKLTPQPEGPFGLTKGMSWEDVKTCCQIEKTAMVVPNVYALKLVTTPKTDNRFNLYYVHLSRKAGVFGITAGTEPIPADQVRQRYQAIQNELIAQYGQPTTSDDNNVIWDKPSSPLGLFRITLSKKDDGETGQVSIFYIFDNNETYQ